MRHISHFPLVLLVCGIATSLVSGQNTENQGLKDIYAGYFPVGASLSPVNIKSDDTLLVLREFNSITAENVMKMGLIHPKKNEYNWEEADRMAAFAQRHGLLMRGHTLCWHNQAGPWIFTNAEGDTVTKEVLLERLRDHIHAVAGRYRGTIYAWDVVNEVISDNPNEFYRSSPWYRICGDEFIYSAFEYAHEAAPEALLFYNDYNTVIPHKRDKIVRLLKELIARGTPIHGMGMQGHWSIFGPTEKDIRDAIEAYSRLGLQIHITELDVSVYPPEHERRDKRPVDVDDFTPEMNTRQVEAYRMYFEVFRDYKDVITSLTFWNLSDGHTWLDHFPVRGRKNYPLLFDREGKRKAAYGAVVEFKDESRTSP